MTLGPTAQDGTPRRVYAASASVLWIAAGAAYLILEAVAAAGFRPHYSYIRNSISDLGVPSADTVAGRMIDSPRAVLMNSAFYLQGVLFFLGALLIVRALDGQKPRVFITLAATNAVGNFMVASVHSGQMAKADGTMWVHAIGALLAIVGGNLAVLAGSSALRGVGGRPWYRRVSVGLGALGLLSFTLFVMGSKVEALALASGLWERCSVYAIILWQILTAACIFTGGRLRHRHRQ